MAVAAGMVAALAAGVAARAAEAGWVVGAGGASAAVVLAGGEDTREAAIVAAGDIQLAVIAGMRRHRRFGEMVAAMAAIVTPMGAAIRLDMAAVTRLGATR